MGWGGGVGRGGVVSDDGACAFEEVGCWDCMHVVLILEHFADMSVAWRHLSWVAFKGSGEGCL